MITTDTQKQLILDGIDPLVFNEFTVRKRDGREAGFEPERIRIAIEKAFRAEYGVEGGHSLIAELQDAVVQITQGVVADVVARAVRGELLEIELIQDAVEAGLMRHGHYTIARKYIVYREERKRARALRGEGEPAEPGAARLTVRLPDGRSEPLDPQKIRRTLLRACAGHENVCPWQEMADEVLRSVYNGITLDELENAMMMAARSRIEREPAYGYVAARLLLRKTYQEVWGRGVQPYEFDAVYRAGFAGYLRRGVECGALTPDLLSFDLGVLAAGLVPERDFQFNYLGLQTVYDRYLLRDVDTRIEVPQYFWLRVAMGLALLEKDHREQRALEFYTLLSTFRFVSSTPTLFNSGTRHPQLSSCYLLTIMDDLQHIFKTYADDAMLSKWAGGLGNDWTNVRATGARIKGTNGRSQGIIPFLKVANDTAVAVNQGGKRKGAMCAYLETWHLDLEDFLDLRKNTGDERRRTHDMNTANWIPDLFMKRVKEQGPWTLFSPSDVPDLHDLTGKAFEEAYTRYERMTETGELKLFKRMDAVLLWRRMLTMLFETGHPWITFKDPSNLRSPQQHCGVVHSSNLCTEILLNTSKEEQAVCNLGSVNLVAHIRDGRLDETLLADTVHVALRMLDNVIDINYYPTPETRAANLRHRPVGLGLMGFQDALCLLRIPYDSDAAVDFADTSMELISYHAILASTHLAAERGAYQSFKGSLWDQGVLPIDSIDILADHREGHLEMDRSARLDWAPVRAAVRKHGMRNSNTMAIAPTATISNIVGVSQSIEPHYKHLFVKSNLSGEFTVINPYLVEDLKKIGLWDEEMVNDLKYFDGSVQEIPRIPADLKQLYRCAFDIDATWLIECASRRQKWIDMGQSLNLYISQPNGAKLNRMYMLAWERGLKTTYYLRSLSATQVEKSTLDVNQRGIQPRWMKNRSASSDIVLDRAAPAAPKQCRLDDPGCEACQ
ncbi:MAG: ribonucleoside-diphosphate reductase subunit alpha [Kiritimatiellia bacterium]